MLLGIFSSQKHWQQISTCQLDIKNGFLICDEEDELTKMAMTQFFSHKRTSFPWCIEQIESFPFVNKLWNKRKNNTTPTTILWSMVTFYSEIHKSPIIWNNMLKRRSNSNFTMFYRKCSRRKVWSVLPTLRSYKLATLQGKISHVVHRRLYIQCEIANSEKKSCLT